MNTNYHVYLMGLKGESYYKFRKSYEAWGLEKACFKIPVASPPQESKPPKTNPHHKGRQRAAIPKVQKILTPKYLKDKKLVSL